MGTAAAGIEGVGPGGGLVRFPVGEGEEGGEPWVLTFLTSSCLGCREFWERFATGRPHELPGAPRVVAVTPGAELEDRAKVAQLASPAVPVVMSARAWEDYGVTGSPFAVVVRGGSVSAEAPLYCWDDLASLLAREAVGGTRP